MKKDSFFSLLAIGLVSLAWILHPAQVHAFAQANPTPIEWDSWSEDCKIWTSDPVPPGRRPPNRSKQVRTQNHPLKVLGIWHACHGFIWLQRAELAPFSPEKDLWVKNALDEIGFTLYRVREREDLPNHPFVGVMRVWYARALRQAGKAGKALKLLDETRKTHPKYPPLYKAIATIGFDLKQYNRAIEALEEGIAKVGDSTGELHYFAGVAWLKKGKLEQARKYEKIAREKGFPLRFLSKKIAEYDAMSPEKREAALKAQAASNKKGSKKKKKKKKNAGTAKKDAPQKKQ